MQTPILILLSSSQEAEVTVGALSYVNNNNNCQINTFIYMKK